MIIFHVEIHPEYPWFQQCVTFHSFPSPAYELAYNVAGFVAMYALPLLTILFCYGSIVCALYKKIGTCKLNYACIHNVRKVQVR